MDALQNPFAPGAGTPPPELTGRAQVLADAETAILRMKAGRSARSALLLGLRGVGKTVLLGRIGAIAADAGAKEVMLEAQESRSLAELLVPRLRSVLVLLSAREQTYQLAKRAMAMLRQFAGTFKVTMGDVEYTVDALPGAADSGDLQEDLAELLVAVGEAAKASGQPLVLLLDEVQFLSTTDLGALIMAMHRLSQRNLPILLYGAGLPQLAGLAGNAKSYAERLFEYPAIGPLQPEAAADAIRIPIERQGATICDEALQLIVEKTQGYPFFLQEWGSQVWRAAVCTTITTKDVEIATTNAVKRLDTSFFKVRFDRLTPRERDYLRAMAERGSGPHRSGDIAVALGRKVTALGPLRDGLIKKGMIYSPQHGELAFTVPLFDEYLRRMMPTPRASDTGSKNL
jgi:hypothetical protein